MLLTRPLAVDAGVAVATIVPADVPEGVGLSASVHAGDLPVRRRANDLARPDNAVMLPQVQNPDDDGPLFSLVFRWLPDGVLRVRRPKGSRRVRIAYLVFNLDGMGGTSRSAITQANALAGDHDVTLLSVTRSGERPHYGIDERVKVRYLVDVREGQDPSVPGIELTPSQARALHERDSLARPRCAGTASSPRCATSASSTCCPASSSTSSSRSPPGCWLRRSSCSRPSPSWCTRSTAPPPTGRPGSSRC